MVSENSFIFSSSSAREKNIPFFKGENYNLWSLMMKTMFRSKDLWTLVEKGFSEEGDGREFDAARMKHGESIQDFVNRVLDIVYKIRAMKEDLPQKVIVSKLLKGLTSRFSQVVHSIISTKDLNTLTVEELSGLLKNHESILNIEGEHHQEGEKALHIGRENTQDRGRGHGYQPNRGRGKRCGRSFNAGRTETSRLGEGSKIYKGMQCFVCKKFGHIKDQCWYRNKEANVVKEEKEKEKEEEEVAFMAISEVPKKTGGVWLIDSGCSNHMTGDVNLFQSLETVPSRSVTVGDGKTLKVCMTSHRLFPLEANDVESAYLAQDGDISDLWHGRYGHINVKKLKQLTEQQLVSVYQTSSMYNLAKLALKESKLKPSFPKE
ncbi:uncharacterized protein LOC120276050 [Dioscorea cayenensis subsp. rotundata]|uniref:Uncharacterized protein LOC120276050 n=1 Tax=Dioscorea cayennensis subsp. rotundata TaxID=55577 RepID=A0AB40CFK1_DIOCR|nr:uncharacterized protein LOC120276050 [Dioscorea cayenensis subsp. rotundata]